MSEVFYLTFFFVILTISIIIGIAVMIKVYPEKIRSEMEIDISVERMIKQEEIVECLRRDYFFSGTEVYQFAKIINVYEGTEQYNVDEKACIHEPDKKGRMFVDFYPGLTREERLFNFAHECAHVINGDSIPNTKLKGHGKPEIEQLADYTAAALIMPYSTVKDTLEQEQFFSVSDSQKMRVIRSLCRKFCVSEMTALKRVKEVNILSEKIDRGYYK